MDGKEPSDIPPVQGREESLGFGLPTNTVVSTKFNDRVNEVFGSLQSLEQKHTETVATFVTDEYDGDEEDERVSEEEWMGSRGSNSEPHNQPKKRKTLSKCDLRRKLDNNKCHNVPNYVVNPEKWKKYSLKDDGSSTMSTGRSADELNTAVAMDFLNQLKKRKSTDAEPPTYADSSAEFDIKASSDNGNEAHTFSVPALPNRTQREDKTDQKDDTAVVNKACSSNHSSKAWSMETFEFGKSSGPTAKKKKILPVRTDNDDSGKCGVVLEHCQEDGENEDLGDENEDQGENIDEEKKTLDIVSDDNDKTCEEADTGASAPPLFNSRGRKQKRGIRKRQQSEDDDGAD